jgi:hypothetical protein
MSEKGKPNFKPGQNDPFKVDSGFQRDAPKFDAKMGQKVSWFDRFNMNFLKLEVFGHKAANKVH